MNRQSVDRVARDNDLRGTPARGLGTATLAFGAGLTTIVFYGAAGPAFKESLGLSSLMLGLLLSSPHVTKATLRILFGGWVDQAGGKKPLLVLLAMTLAGMGGLVAMLFAYYPDGFNSNLVPILIACGLLAGAGGATFSVSVPMASFWYPARKQGFSLGFAAGVGNITPGLVNFLLPILIVLWGISFAYLSWFVVVLLATVAFAILGVDAFYFQLVRRGVNDDNARRIARDADQDVFPNGNSRDSLLKSARNSKTWILVALYTVSFGGGFTALATWFPTYFNLFHELDIGIAGLLAGIFTVYGSLIRVPGGVLSDRWGGETVTIVGFAAMLAGGCVMTVCTSVALACFGMFLLGSGMGVANAGIFALVPKYIPNAVGGASGWISGVGGAGTLIVLPVLGGFVDVMGPIGYARGFVIFVILSGLCVSVAYMLRRAAVRAR